jgi:hypothetical protein
MCIMRPFFLFTIILFINVSADFESDIIVRKKQSTSSHSLLSFSMQHLLDDLPVPRTMDLSRRDLQSQESSKPPLSATILCEGLNEASSLWNCTCEELGATDVKAVCELVLPCESNTTCIAGSIEQYFVPLSASQAAVNATFSCISYPNSDTPEAKTCIRVFPKAPGDFSEIASCSAQYQPDANTEPVTCHSCESCQDTTNTNDGQNGTATASISLNCCNVVTDLKQTCQPVQKTGATFPLWDEIPPDQKGQCSSASPIAWFTSCAGLTVYTGLSLLFLYL